MRQGGNATAKKPSGENGDGKSLEDKEMEKLQKNLEAAILTETPDVQWDDIAGLMA